VIGQEWNVFDVNFFFLRCRCGALSAGCLNLHLRVRREGVKFEGIGAPGDWFWINCCCPYVSQKHLTKERRGLDRSEERKHTWRYNEGSEIWAIEWEIGSLRGGLRVTNDTRCKSDQRSSTRSTHWVI